MTHHSIYLSLSLRIFAIIQTMVDRLGESDETRITAAELGAENCQFLKKLYRTWPQGQYEIGKLMQYAGWLEPQTWKPRYPHMLLRRIKRTGRVTNADVEELARVCSIASCAFARKQYNF